MDKWGGGLKWSFKNVVVEFVISDMIKDIPQHSRWISFFWNWVGTTISIMLALFTCRWKAAARPTKPTTTNEVMCSWNQFSVLTGHCRETRRRSMLCCVYSTRLGQRAGSPKFVVTLDGASESLSEMDTIDTDTLLTSSAASARNVVRVKPQTQPLARLQEGSCN